MALCILGGYWDVRLRGHDLVEATLRRFQEWRAARPPDIGITTQSALIASRQHGLAGGFQVGEQRLLGGRQRRPDAGGSLGGGRQPRRDAPDARRSSWRC